MTDDLDALAKGLTYAQAAAVRGIYAWATPWEQDEGEAALYRLGIWNPKPKHRASILTPLGLRLRARIAELEADKAQWVEIERMQLGIIPQSTPAGEGDE